MARGSCCFECSLPGGFWTVLDGSAWFCFTALLFLPPDSAVTRLQAATEDAEVTKPWNPSLIINSSPHKTLTSSHHGYLQYHELRYREAYRLPSWGAADSAFVLQLFEISWVCLHLLWWSPRRCGVSVQMTDRLSIKRHCDVFSSKFALIVLLRNDLQVVGALPSAEASWVSQRVVIPKNSRLMIGCRRLVEMTTITPLISH